MVNLDKITLCSFQPRAVYDEILKNGIYRLTKDNFFKYTNIEKSYKHYHQLEKYERIKKKSKLPFYPNTMPIWGWYKDEFPTGFKEVAPFLYEGVLERVRKNSWGEYEELVGLFLSVPKNEVYLTNFQNWDFFLFSERNDDNLKNFNNWTQEEQDWYLADVAEAEHYFSKIEEIDGDVKVQGILTEIRKDMIIHVLEESVN